MKVIVKKVGEEAEVQEIENSLTKLQELVGGYFRPYRLNAGLYILVNEEGLIHDLPLNIFITEGNRVEAIVGDIVFVTYDDNGDIDDLNDFHMNWVWTRLTEGGHGTNRANVAYKIGILRLDRTKEEVERSVLVKEISNTRFSDVSLEKLKEIKKILNR